MQYSFHPSVVTAVPMSHGLVAAYHLPSAPAAAAPRPLQAPSRPQERSVERVNSKETAHSAEAEKTHRITSSMDDTHEIAKSVLLLAKGGHDKAHKTAQEFNTHKRDSPSMDSTDSSKAPLKKRKMVTAEAAIKDDSASVRVSPVSHTSVMSPANTHATSCADSKHTPERSLPAQVVVVAHLPTELYRLLDQEEHTNVMQWLPHGRAWRIVRWDALRKTILPRYFGGTSVDSFLAQIADWGFTEITDGPDAGAYYNAFFRRGFPHLCKDMQCKPRPNVSPVKTPPNNSHSPALKHETTPHTHVSTHSSSSKSAPSILQVPSLASPKDGSPTSPPVTKRAANNTSPYGGYVSTARPNMPFWFVDAHHQQAVLVQYRPSTDEAAHSPGYSPAVVRSTRGRPRPPIVTPVRRVDESCASSMASVGSSYRSSFPVSRRGRAARPVSTASSLRSTEKSAS